MVVVLAATALNLCACLRANMKGRLFGVDDVDKHELSPQGAWPPLSSRHSTLHGEQFCRLILERLHWG
jgi:hypothetical protein